MTLNELIEKISKSDFNQYNLHIWQDLEEMQLSLCCFSCIDASYRCAINTIPDDIFEIINEKKAKKEKEKLENNIKCLAETLRPMRVPKETIIAYAEKIKAGEL